VHTKPIAGLSGLIAALLLLTAVPAVAESVTVGDPDGDTQSRSDIQRMKVTNSRADNSLHVRVALSRIVIGAPLTVYLDRNLDNKGPELRMVAYPDSEWMLFRVGNWEEHGESIGTCGRVSYSDSTKNPAATWDAKRSCLNIDRAVRVAAKVVDPDRGRDWIPAKQTFSERISAKH
jgi:hypothetical protein